MLVKICGLRRRRDVDIAVEAGADMVGFIFVPGTPRTVEPETSTWIRHLSGVEKVGVFRDAALEQIIDVADRLQLDRVQLHGSEPDDWIKRVGLPVIRRVPVPPEGVDRKRVECILDLGALPLVDPGGGDGIPCDWSALGRCLGGLWFALAGGLTPNSVAEAVKAAQPQLVDVSSGVEVAPAVKDPCRIERFIAAARTPVLL